MRNHLSHRWVKARLQAADKHWMGRLSDPNLDGVFESLPIWRSYHRERRWSGAGDRPPDPSAGELLAVLKRLVGEELRLQRIALRKNGDAVRLHRLTMTDEAFCFEVCWYSPKNGVAIVPPTSARPPIGPIVSDQTRFGPAPARPVRDSWSWPDLAAATVGLERLLLPPGANSVLPSSRCVDVRTPNASEELREAML